MKYSLSVTSRLLKRQPDKENDLLEEINNIYMFDNLSIYDSFLKEIEIFFTRIRKEKDV